MCAVIRGSSMIGDAVSVDYRAPPSPSQAGCMFCAAHPLSATGAASGQYLPARVPITVEGSGTALEVLTLYAVYNRSDAPMRVMHVVRCAGGAPSILYTSTEAAPIAIVSSRESECPYPHFGEISISDISWKARSRSHELSLVKKIAYVWH